MINEIRIESARNDISCPQYWYRFEICMLYVVPVTKTYNQLQNMKLIDLAFIE